MSDDKAKAIGALLDVIGGRRNESQELVDRISPKRFGRGKARILRKMVLVAIAASAEKDGTGAYPSRETIAHRCLVSVRAVANAIEWLRKHKLLTVDSKGSWTSKYGRTNRYTILFNEPVPVCKKRERTKHKAIEVPGAIEAQGTYVHGEQKAPGTIEQAPGKTEKAPGTISEAQGNRSAHYRPSLPPSVSPFVPVGGEEEGGDALAPLPLQKAYGNGGNVEENLTLLPDVTEAQIQKMCAHLLRSLYRLGDYTFDGRNRDALMEWLKRGFNPHEIEGAYRRFLPTLTDRDVPYAPTRFCRGAGETLMVDMRINAIQMSCKFFHSLEVSEHDVEEYILPALPEEPLMYIKLLYALNLWLDEKLSLADFNRQHQAALLPLSVEERRQYLKEHLATDFSLKPFLADAPVYARLAMDRAHAASVYEQAQKGWAFYQPQALEETAGIA
jgi:Helix-turn-helix domain